VSGPVRLALGNRCVLLLHEDHSSPMIAFRGSVRAGAAFGRPGVAEFASRLLLRGTRRRTASQLADAIEDAGAAVSCANGMESATIEGRCTRESLRPIMRILVESLSEPAFPPAELEKVRGEILGDIREQQDDTRRAAARRLFEIVYPATHPFHRDPKGDAGTAAGTQRPVVRAFHEAFYGAAGMIFGFSGDLDVDTLQSTVAGAFETLEAGQEPAPVPLPKATRRGSAVVPMPHKSQADFVAGRIAVPRTHPDYYAVNLANILLGRIGLYGRMGAKVRDELGLAYYSFSTLDARRAAGHWTVSAGVNPKNLAKAVSAIRSEMERLKREPFSDAEIRDGKTHLVGALQVALERNAEYASALHDIEYFGLGADFLARYPRIVRSLDADDVRRKAVEYFDPDECSWVASGPVKGMKLAF